MAFGRKKRKGEQEEAENPAASPEETVGEPSNGAFPPAQETTADDAPADEPSPATATHDSVGEAEPSSPSPLPEAGEDLTEATATAGDPAAAGTDAEGPGTAWPVDTPTHGVAAPGGAPAPGATATAEQPDPETVGSVAASPEPAAVPAAHGRESYSGAASGEDSAGPAEKVGAAAAGAESLVESRPELLVAVAFAGGLVVARVLGAFGGDR